MRQDVSDNAGLTALYRQSAMEPASRRPFGSVIVVLPPSATVTLAIGLLALLLLAFAAWYVEIPDRVRAAGVLMPPDGLRDIVAGTPGKVGRISVAEGQYVHAGELLLEIVNDREELARFQLRSLRAELALLDEAHARQQAIDRNRIDTLDEQRLSLDEQLAVAKQEYELQRQQVALLERRLSRRRNLAGKGGVSPDALDREQSLLLQARTHLAAIRHSILDYEQQIVVLSRTRRETDDEAKRREILHDLERRRLGRQVVEQENRVVREIRAPEAGVVARINVRPGTTIGPGEPVLKVYRPYETLEAWLYLASSQAGFLEPGQAVELQIDAYPFEMFGTLSAIVTSASRVAVIPRELKVPLALRGPVFEIRARLDDREAARFDASGPFRPGTSFQSDLVKRRYRLYEWLLRHVVTNSAVERA